MAERDEEPEKWASEKPEVQKRSEDDNSRKLTEKSFKFDDWALI